MRRHQSVVLCFLVLLSFSICSNLLSASFVEKCITNSDDDGTETTTCKDIVTLHYSHDSASNSPITVQKAADSDSGSSHNLTSDISISCIVVKSNYVYPVHDFGFLYPYSITERALAYTLGMQCTDSPSDYSCPEITGSVRVGDAVETKTLTAGRGRCCDLSCLIQGESIVGSNTCRYQDMSILSGVISTAHCPELSMTYYSGGTLSSRNIDVELQCIVVIDGETTAVPSVTISNSVVASGPVKVSLVNPTDGYVDENWSNKALFYFYEEGETFDTPKDMSPALIVDQSFVCKDGEVNCIGHTEQALAAWREQPGFCTSPAGTGLDNQIKSLVNADSDRIGEKQLPRYQLCHNRDCTLTAGGLVVPTSQIKLSTIIEIEGSSLVVKDTASSAEIVTASGVSFVQGIAEGIITATAKNTGGLSATYVTGISGCDLEGMFIPPSQTLTIASKDTANVKFSFPMTDINMDVEIKCTVTLTAHSTGQTLDSTTVTMKASDLIKQDFSGGISSAPGGVNFSEMTGSLCSSWFTCCIEVAVLVLVIIAFLVALLIFLRCCAPKLVGMLTSSATATASNVMTGTVSGFSLSGDSSKSTSLGSRLRTLRPRLPSILSKSQPAGIPADLPDVSPVNVTASSFQSVEAGGGMGGSPMTPVLGNSSASMGRFVHSGMPDTVGLSAAHIMTPASQLRSFASPGLGDVSIASPSLAQSKSLVCEDIFDLERCIRCGRFIQGDVMKIIIHIPSGRSTVTVPGTLNIRDNFSPNNIAGQTHAELQSTVTVGAGSPMVFGQVDQVLEMMRERVGPTNTPSRITVLTTPL